MRKRLMNYLILCICLFVSMPVAAQEAQSVPIILYHNFAYNFHPSQDLMNTAPDTFEAHMVALKEAGYHTISYDQYYDYITQGTPLPEKPIIITMDDGYTSNYKYAYPILKKLDMCATIFVVTSRMGSSDTVYPHFTWEQAAEMEKSGVISIESHTDTHGNMSLLPETEIVEEFRRSKFEIERNLGKECSVLAFPYGEFLGNAIDLALQAGYKIINKVGDEGTNRKEDGLYPLKRISVGGNMTPQMLLELIEQNCK